MHAITRSLPLDSLTGHAHVHVWPNHIHRKEAALGQRWAAQDLVAHVKSLAIIWKLLFLPTTSGHSVALVQMEVSVSRLRVKGERDSV